MLNRQYFVLWLITLILVLSISSCAGQSPVAPQVTAPAISVQITKDVCPSIEVQAGTQVAWMNLDTVDRAVIIERMDEQGVVISSGGTDLLAPGDSFSTTLEAGQYAYYCSKDRTIFGMITVSPVSYPYP